MNKEKLIEMLIDDDIGDWRSDAERNSYFQFILYNGIEGYKNQTGQELLIEVVERGLLILKSNYPECSCCGIDNYVCFMCEIDQISEARKELNANNDN
jgi:hypothetical protein